MSRTSVYYRPKKPDKDWGTKQMIEVCLREHPTYGHKRVALHLKINKKRVLRVMKLYGIKPYRRTAKKLFVIPKRDCVYPNLLLTETPQGKGDIYAADFTYIRFKGEWIYPATVIDLFTREIVGVAVLSTHATELVINAFFTAIHHLPPPRIIHSDQGSEYTSEEYTDLTRTVGTRISMSAPGCPWENGYQESFYKGFKLQLGDPGRFETLGELVAAIYEAISYYNKSRIHTALKMSPQQFANRSVLAMLKSTEKVS
jgi:putative transposase